MFITPEKGVFFFSIHYDHLMHYYTVILPDNYCTIHNTHDMVLESVLLKVHVRVISPIAAGLVNTDILLYTKSSNSIYDNNMPVANKYCN